MMNNRYAKGMIHSVKEGETLFLISRLYRVPLALILRANPYVDVYNLKPNQKINIPVSRQMHRPFSANRKRENNNGKSHNASQTYQREVIEPAEPGQQKKSMEPLRTEKDSVSKEMTEHVVEMG